MRLIRFQNSLQADTGSLLIFPVRSLFCMFSVLLQARFMTKYHVRGLWWGKKSLLYCKAHEQLPTPVIFAAMCTAQGSVFPIHTVLLHPGLTKGIGPGNGKGHTRFDLAVRPSIYSRHDFRTKFIQFGDFNLKFPMYIPIYAADWNWANFGVFLCGFVTFFYIDDMGFPNITSVLLGISIHISYAHSLCHCQGAY